MSQPTALGILNIGGAYAAPDVEPLVEQVKGLELERALLLFKELLADIAIPYRRCADLALYQTRIGGIAEIAAQEKSRWQAELKIH